MTGPGLLSSICFLITAVPFLCGGMETGTVVRPAWTPPSFSGCGRLRKRLTRYFTLPPNGSMLDNTLIALMQSCSRRRQEFDIV